MKNLNKKNLRNDFKMNEREMKNYFLENHRFIDEPSVKIKNSIRYRFRLTGVPPNQAIKIIKLDPNQTITKIKKIIQREYKLNPILAIQFIFKYKVLSGSLKLREIGFHPKNDLICVMSAQSGAGKREMKCLQCGTSNVNEILVSFAAEDEKGHQYNDITTLPKFLYYLEHLSDKRGQKIYQPTPYKIINVNNYCCVKCHNTKVV